LLFKLTRYGFVGRLLNWISAFLTNRIQTVRINQTYSVLESVISGVPQGSVIGPLLFAMHVNDLPDVIFHSSISLYADDSKISKQIIFNELSSLQFQEDLNRVYSWSTAWQLSIAASKCSVLVFGTSVHADFRYFLGTFELEIVDSVRDGGLGLGLGKNPRPGRSRSRWRGLGRFLTETKTEISDIQLGDLHLGFCKYSTKYFVFSQV
jgi:hypothetical protein